MMSKFQYLLRAFQIAWVCLRNLLQIVLARLGLAQAVAGPDRLRLLLEELGGSFLKFGQILSLQIDTLPREYCDALLNLLDRVPPFTKGEVWKVFAEELGNTPDNLFQEFHPEPLASASIGQVHRGVLKDSTVVAVKVQRPGVQEVFRRDAILLNLFVRIIFFFKFRSLYFMRDPVREFNDWIQDELDYRREAAHGEVLGRNAKATPTEVVPKIHWNLTTGRILTMDFLEGPSVLEYMRMVEERDEKRLAEMDQLGFNPPIFISNVITNFLSDAFRFGVFHADLHPANLLILKDNVVGYVDFGIVGHLTPEARQKQIQLSMAYARGKTEDIFSAFLSVSTFTDEVDLTGFRQELARRSRQWYREPAIGGIPHLSRSLTSAMFDLLALCRAYGLLVDREMIKYIRSLILADGLVSRMAPGLDLAPQIRSVCEDFYGQQARGRLFSRGAALTFLADLSGWLLAGPSQLLHTMERFERRQVRLRTRLAPSSDREAGMRTRAIVGAAVWFSVAIVLFTSGENIPAGISSPAGTLLVGFWGGWTLWMLRLLRRLAGA
ncbi:MAG: AarF/ABC1/UbiB kinase family protein [Acidobacteria bacterium]|nr:AarF/ABC1/UbiB kinase family protein [Acidobacteriota bacterium]